MSRGHPGTVDRETLERALQDAAAYLTDLGAQIRAIQDTASVSSGDDEHDPEGQTVAYEQAQLRALRQTARRDVVEADEALARWDAGTYGFCERCGVAIPEERLEARPTARTCVSCASA